MPSRGDALDRRLFDVDQLASVVCKLVKPRFEGDRAWPKPWLLGIQLSCDDGIGRSRHLRAANSEASG